MQCEVVKDCWTIDELRRELLIWTGTEVGRSQLYEWLPYALIVHRGTYTDRDRAKLIKFGEIKTETRSLRVACSQLRFDIKKNPGRYPKEPIQED